VGPHAAHVLLPPVVDLALFRQMADLSNEGFYLLDRTGRFLYVNAKGHAQMGGYTMEELLALRVPDICDVSAERFAEFVAMLEHGPLPAVETWTRRKDGSLFLLEVSMARVDFGGDVYLFGVAGDVTERKAAEALRKSLAAQLLHTLETERQRVARELHDDVGQALATVGVLLNALDASPGAVPRTAKPALATTRATIARIGESLARIVREYHPIELLGLGLEDTLRAHARQFAERHGLALQLTTVPVEGLLTPEQELHVYRVVQEALANAARHARPARIGIELRRADDHLTVTVHDDGVGFDPNHPPAPHGIGLVTMRERAMLMHGTLAIESDSRRGTSVRLAVPFAVEGAPVAEPWRSAVAANGAARPAAAPAAALLAADSSPLPAALDLEVFRRMADMSSEAIRLADRDGRLLYVNNRSCTLSGFSREELLGMRVSEINPDFPPEAWEKYVAAAPRRVPAFETRNRRKDGTLIPVEVSAARLEVNGESYFVAVIRDISDRKETEIAQRGFTRRLLHMLEAERRRVAREVDNEVGQAVATVGVLLHTIEHGPGSVPEELRSGLSATHATIRQITESVARIARDYHPTELLGLGLEETLRTHARQFAHRHSLILRLATASVEGSLSDEHALHVYRIMQEALSNVARHARARHVSVRLARRGRHVVATVRDDGVGLDLGRSRATGLGLVTMRERAALMGATLELRAKPGRGTAVRLKVPVEQRPTPA
jgi:two-component system, NarL family, sensor histidine kinase NreB